MSKLQGAVNYYARKSVWPVYTFYVESHFKTCLIWPIDINKDVTTELTTDSQQEPSSSFFTK